jgi:hypothetical protein
MPVTASSRAQQRVDDQGALRRDTLLADITRDARAHWDTGRAFYVAKLNLGGTEASWMAVRESAADDVAGALQTIESVGWQLESTGYVFQPFRERSHALTDSAGITGRIIGVYTFRRPVG